MLDTAELEHYFQALAARDKFSGVALITQGRSQLFAGAYGYASRSWRIPNSLATRFDTASVTKLFTVVAVLQLIDQGHLSLETRVTERLGLQDTTVSSAVNVFHLLTHTRHFPQRAISVVLLSNMEAGVWERIWKVHELIYNT